MVAANFNESQPALSAVPSEGPNRFIIFEQLVSCTVDRSGMSIMSVTTGTICPSRSLPVVGKRLFSEHYIKLALVVVGGC